jgi:hypothetical protein
LTVAEEKILKELVASRRLRLVSASTGEPKQQLCEDEPSMLLVGVTHLRKDVPPPMLQQYQREHLESAPNKRICMLGAGAARSGENRSDLAASAQLREYTSPAERRLKRNSPIGLGLVRRPI